MRATALRGGSVAGRVAGGLLLLAAACNGLLGNQDAVVLERGPDAAFTTDGAPCPSSAPPETDASQLTDPVPTETVNAGVSFVYHKDLHGDPMYGDSGADILFSGQVGAWHFGLPTGSFKSAQVALSLVADDHGTGPAVGYTYEIWSEACHAPTTMLAHGYPDPGFTNWVEVTEPTDRMATSLVVTMKNTSDVIRVGPRAWIGVDWIELRLFL